MSSSKYSPVFPSSPLFGWCQCPVGASTIICLQLADGARWPFTSSQSISLLLLPLSLLLHHPRPTLSQLKQSSAAHSQSETQELSRLAAGCKIAGGQRGRGVSVCLLYERWWYTEWPPWHTHKHMHTYTHTHTVRYTAASSFLLPLIMCVRACLCLMGVLRSALKERWKEGRGGERVEGQREHKEGGQRSDENS